MTGLILFGDLAAFFVEQSDECVRSRYHRAGTRRAQDVRPGEIFPAGCDNSPCLRRSGVERANTSGLAFRALSAHLRNKN
jgi:hypothetical protein